MGIISNIQSLGMKTLNDIIHESNNVIIKVPMLNSTSNYIKYSVKGLISGIELAEIPTILNSTVDTLVCKLIISELKLITNCPTSDYMAKNVIIEYKNKSYSVIKDKLDSFESLLILYLNKK